MNTKVWYLSYFESVYHTGMIETFSHANAHMVHMVNTMDENTLPFETREIDHQAPSTY